MPTDAAPLWHPCDDFLDPMTRVIEPVVIYDPIEDAEDMMHAFNKLQSIQWQVTFHQAKWWFELHLGVDYSDRLFRRLQDFGFLVTEWIGQFDSWQVDLRTPEFEKLDDVGDLVGSDIEVLLSKNREATAARKALRAGFENIFVEACALLAYLNQVSAMLRATLTRVDLFNDDRFVPSELQRIILEALCRQAMTVDELEGELNVSRRTLYGAKTNKNPQGTGGLNELKALGFVRNNRRIGGYYRPDAPPVEK